MQDFAKYPAFEGNVAVVDTRDFWRDAAVSPASQGYHWNRNSETYFLIGQSMAQEMNALMPDPSYHALTVNNGTGGGEYAAGSVVNITAAAPPEGQVFLAWTGDVAGVADVNSASTTLTMPAGPAAVEATYGHHGIPFVETFDDLTPGPLHGQRGWVAEQAVVQGATTFGGSRQAASFVEAGGSLRRTFTDGRTGVWTDLRVRVQPMADDTVPVPPGGSTAVVYVGPGYEVMVFDGDDSVATGTTVEEDDWVRFTVHSDYGTATWRLFVNGSPIGTYAFHETAVATYTGIEIRGGPTTFVDDIAITPDAPDLGLPPPIDDLYEYALDNQAPAARVDEGLLRYSHLVRNDDASLVYQLQTRESLLLGGWENADTVPAETIVTGTVFDEVVYRIEMDDPVRFFRLRIFLADD